MVEGSNRLKDLRVSKGTLEWVMGCLGGSRSPRFQFLDQSCCLCLRQLILIRSPSSKPCFKKLDFRTV